jgi:hypothetical protein
MANQIEVYVVGEAAADEGDWLLRQTYYCTWFRPLIPLAVQARETGMG